MGFREAILVIGSVIIFLVTQVIFRSAFYSAANAVIFMIIWTVLTTDFTRGGKG